MSNETPFRAKIMQKAKEIFENSSLPLNNQLALIRKCVMAQSKLFTKQEEELNKDIERHSVVIEKKVNELEEDLARKKEKLRILKLFKNTDDSWLEGIDL